MKVKAYIAFQGGGALGMAHLGAWQTINERFEIVGAIGTSAGAIVAAHCAAGYDPAHVIDIFQALDWKPMVARQGLLGLIGKMDAWSDGELFYQWLLARIVDRFPGMAAQEMTFHWLLNKTGVALSIVACDLNQHPPKPVIFDASTEPNTTVAFAVRASISIPGYFTTVSRRDRSGQMLVDGGVLLNFPASQIQAQAQAQKAPLVGVRFTQPRAYLDRPKIWETIGRTKDILLAVGSVPSDSLLNDHNYIDVAIDVSGFDALNFNLTDSEKQALVKHGRTAAEKALLTYDLRWANHQRQTSIVTHISLPDSTSQPPVQETSIQVKPQTTIVIPTGDKKIIKGIPSIDIEQFNLDSVPELRDLLLTCRCMQQQQSRDLIIRRLPDEVKHTLSRGTNLSEDIELIILHCLNFDGAFDIFLGAIYDSEKNSRTWKRVESWLNNQSNVLDGD